VQAGLDALARAAQGREKPDGADRRGGAGGATHGEICAALRRELGFGQPLAIV